MVTQIEIHDTVKIYGTKPLKLDRPGQYIQVHLFDLANSKVVGSAKSDNNGYFYIEIPKAIFTYGSYQVRFYGYGIIEKEFPEGDWEILNIVNPTPYTDSEVEPSSPKTGDLWWNSATALLKIYHPSYGWTTIGIL